MNIDYSLNAGIYVYYSSLKYILITEQSQMHIIDLILNVGGTLGLFIGVSFVSLFEISEIILEIIMIISGKKSKLNQVNIELQANNQIIRNKNSTDYDVIKHEIINLRNLITKINMKVKNLSRKIKTNKKQL